MARGGLTAAQIMARNARIVAERLRSPTATWVDIGAKYGVGADTASDVYRGWAEEHKDALVTDTADYLLVVAEKIAAFKELRSQFAELAERGVNANAKVGALRQIVELHWKEIELLQRTGLMPHDLGVIRYQVDIRYITEKMIEIFDRYVPAAMQEQAEDELIRALEGQLPSAQAAAAVLPPAPDDYELAATEGEVGASASDPTESGP